jgi:hypothetical protein
VKAFTGESAGRAEDGLVFTREFSMNTKQMVATGVMAILLLGTILMMPAEMPGAAAQVKRTGAVVTPAKVPAGLSQGQVGKVNP